MVQHQLNWRECLLFSWGKLTSVAEQFALTLPYVSAASVQGCNFPPLSFQWIERIRTVMWPLGSDITFCRNCGGPQSCWHLSLQTRLAAHLPKVKEPNRSFCFIQLVILCVLSWGLYATFPQNHLRLDKNAKKKGNPNPKATANSLYKKHNILVWCRLKLM